MSTARQRASGGSVRRDGHSWRFDEYAPVGVDLGSPAAVAAFDRNQGTNPTADAALLDRLGVAAGAAYVDLGCGTGSLVRAAAHRGADAHGVDVSPEMLAFAKRLADAAGVHARWHPAGFLELTAWLDRVSRPPGEDFTPADFETHLREEFSTYGWILTGMLERAGFALEASEAADPVYAEYVCRHR